MPFTQQVFGCCIASLLVAANAASVIRAEIDAAGTHTHTIAKTTETTDTCECQGDYSLANEPQTGRGYTLICTEKHQNGACGEQSFARHNMWAKAWRTNAAACQADGKVPCSETPVTVSGSAAPAAPGGSIHKIGTNYYQKIQGAGCSCCGKRQERTIGTLEECAEAMIKSGTPDGFFARSPDCSQDRSGDCAFVWPAKTIAEVQGKFFCGQCGMGELGEGGTGAIQYNALLKRSELEQASDTNVGRYSEAAQLKGLIDQAGGQHDIKQYVNSRCRKAHSEGFQNKGWKCLKEAAEFFNSRDECTGKKAFANLAANGACEICDDSTDPQFEYLRPGNGFEIHIIENICDLTKVQGPN